MHDEQNERRAHPRFPFSLDVDIRKLALAFSPELPVRRLRGRLQNLSRGGLSILTPESLNGATLLVCEIVLPDLPVPVPVLANVRWSEPRNGGEQSHLYGLEFMY